MVEADLGTVRVPRSRNRDDIAVLRSRENYTLDFSLDGASVAAFEAIANEQHRLLAAPLPQLLPRLHQFLHRTRRWECVAVDNPAIAVRPLIEIEHRAHAHV